VLPTFTEQQIQLLVQWKPKSKYQRRLHLLVLFLLDTGSRITEALSVRVREIDFENLLANLDGKGRKQRVVPFSFELRKAICRYCKDYDRKADSLLFGNRNETMLGRRNTLRDVKALYQKLGFTPPGRTWQATRHTFAIWYLRRVGNVFALQRVMGHSDLETTASP
jgi:integrase/recombinase XerD